jgi:hypothetical protein
MAHIDPLLCEGTVRTDPAVLPLHMYLSSTLEQVHTRAVMREVNAERTDFFHRHAALEKVMQAVVIQSSTDDIPRTQLSTQLTSDFYRYATHAFSFAPTRAGFPDLMEFTYAEPSKGTFGITYAALCARSPSVALLPGPPISRSALHAALSALNNMCPDPFLTAPSQGRPELPAGLSKLLKLLTRSDKPSKFRLGMPTNNIKQPTRLPDDLNGEDAVPLDLFIPNSSVPTEGDAVRVESILQAQLGQDLRILSIDVFPEPLCNEGIATLRLRVNMDRSAGSHAEEIDPENGWDEIRFR